MQVLDAAEVTFACRWEGVSPIPNNQIFSSRGKYSSFEPIPVTRSRIPMRHKCVGVTEWDPAAHHPPPRAIQIVSTREGKNKKKNKFNV